MRYQLDEDGTKLIITMSAEEKAELVASLAEAEFPDSDGFMHDVFESLVANSELMWINPSDTGDMTEAPMLGILGDETRLAKGASETGYVLCGGDEHGGIYHPIISRWAFMDYQVRSPVRDLADNGLVVFIGGKL